MGAPKGHPKYPGAGRAKGTPNKRNSTIRERLERLKCDPFEVLALTAIAEIPCGVCYGKGKTQFQPARRKLLMDQGEAQTEYVEEGKPSIRTCQSCWGSGKERISPKERAWAAAELAQYLEAKLKATEHSFAAGTGETLAAILTARRDRLAKEASL